MNDATLHETKIHGTATAPYSVYHGNIPEWIVSFPLHWHQEFELIYCMAGEVQVTVWGQAFVLYEKDLLVVLPHAVHSIEQSGGMEGEYYNIVFHPSVFRWAEEDPCYEAYVLPFLRRERDFGCLYRAGSGFNLAVTPCILSILRHRRERYTTHAFMMRSNLFLIFHHMYQYSTAATEEGGSLQLSYGRLKNAIYYVQHFYDRDVSVQSAARQCGFSESHFMKLFKELTGMGFNAYLVDYRLTLAAKQLSGTDHKIIDIAESCGFHNPSYFSRVFQRKYQKTPKAYRTASRASSAGEDLEKAPDAEQSPAS